MQQFILSICLTGVLFIVSVLFLMRSWMSRTEPDLSSSDEGSESEADELSGINRSLDTDAVNPDGGRHSVNLTISEVRKIEESLDDYEKISLIFLLSDDPRDCLKKIGLSEWAKQEKLKSNTWEEKIWEALAIIKNFQIPKKYGFSKEHLIEEYFPFQYFTTKHVSKFKKILYFICENFNQANEKIFCQQLRKDFEKRGLRFVDFSEMEMYFSYLLEISYISPKSTKNCSLIAKTLHMEDAYDLFKSIEEDNTNRREVRRTKVNRLYSNSSTNISADDEVNNDSCISVANSDSTQDNVPVRKSLDGIYNMHGKKLCLIIDQENFYTELDPEYKHLLPANNDEEKLHTRVGTKEDSKRLESVLMKRNFEVTVVRNRNHLKIIEELKKFIARIDRRTCSCFFVTILSHGNKDVVYGSNSCFVEISQIISIMDSKLCYRIPKILILQACQGPNLLKHIDENLTTDGATAVEGSDPKSSDFMLFSSTVPGFASVRDKKKGTWFIQSFCDQIEIYADKEHFQDICTRVTEDVGNHKWRQWNHSYKMIPYLKSTMFKKLYI